MGMTPPTVKRLYNLRERHVLPAGVQPPFSDPKAEDDVINTAAWARQSANESPTGFDDCVAFYGQGTLRDWWTEDDRTNFDERATAFSGRCSYESHPVSPKTQIGSWAFTQRGLRRLQFPMQIMKNGSHARQAPHPGWLSLRAPDCFFFGHGAGLGCHVGRTSARRWQTVTASGLKISVTGPLRHGT